MSNIDDKFDFPCGKPGVSGLIDAMNSHMESSGRSDAVTMLWIGYLNALQEWDVDALDVIGNATKRCVVLRHIDLLADHI